MLFQDISCGKTKAIYQQLKFNVSHLKMMAENAINLHFTIKSRMMRLLGVYTRVPSLCHSLYF